MTGVVDEAEDAYSSGIPGLILLVLFQEFLYKSFFCLNFALILLTLSLDYDSVEMLVIFFVVIYKPNPVVILPCYDVYEICLVIVIPSNNIIFD